MSELGSNGQVSALEAQLKANHGGNGWIVGNNLTAADVAIYRLFGMTLRGVDADAFKKSWCVCRRRRRRCRCRRASVDERCFACVGAARRTFKRSSAALRRTPTLPSTWRRVRLARSEREMIEEDTTALLGSHVSVAHKNKTICCFLQSCLAWPTRNCSILALLRGAVSVAFTSSARACVCVCVRVRVSHASGRGSGCCFSDVSRRRFQFVRP